MIEGRQIIVKGKVQGVNFRYHTRRQAQKLGLFGTVENLPDGRVMLRAEGKTGDLDALADWCRVGPDSARVEGIEVSECPVQGLKQFSILP
jgi:acylphosphatase